MPNKFHSLLNWNACARSNGQWLEERFPAKPPIALWWAVGKYGNRNLEIFRAKVLESHRLLCMKGQRWEVNSKIDRNIFNNSDCFVALKYVLKRFTKTQTICGFWKESTIHFIERCSFFIFLMFLLQRVYQIWCTFNTGLFCTDDCMGNAPMMVGGKEVLMIRW